MTAFKMQCRRTARDTEQCKSLYPVILSSIFQGLKFLLEYPSIICYSNADEHVCDSRCAGSLVLCHTSIESKYGILWLPV